MAAPKWMNNNFYDQKRCQCIILILKNYPNILEFMFDKNSPKLSMSAEKILSETSGLSSDEKVLIKIALDLWDGSGNASYISLVNLLSEDNYQRVIQATSMMRNI